MNKLSGIILARGTSARLSQDKAFLKIGPQSFLQIIINKLRPLCAEIIVSTKHPDPRLKSFRRIRVVTDILPFRGSLIGIYSCLKAARYKHAFVVACDMPLVNPRFIRYLIRYAPDFDVVIPASPKGLEPLCAIYSKNCLGPIETQLRQGELKIIDFFPAVRVKVIRLTEITYLKDPSLAGLFNINTPRDYQKVTKSYERLQKVTEGYSNPQ